MRRAVVLNLPADVGHEAFRGVDAVHPRRPGHREDGLAEGARAAPHVQPAAVRRHVEPGEELARDQTAPAADV